MRSQDIETLRAEIGGMPTIRPSGRIARIGHGLIQVAGLGGAASIGDRVRIGGAGAKASAWGEVLSLSAAEAGVLVEGDATGLAIGHDVTLFGPATIAPHDGWAGRIIDPAGRPLDGLPLVQGSRPRALQSLPPPAAARRRLGPRLETGLAAFNTLLPLVRGQRIGLFAGSGVGKSTLLADLARGVAADVIVIALIGERGRELRDFTETALGPEGMARAVVVAATSDQPPLVRRRCAWAAMAVAEHFRDAGLHVLFLADSVTRFAEAHREIALAGGEVPSLRGFPPSTSQAIMALAERAGPGPDSELPTGQNPGGAAAGRTGSGSGGAGGIASGGAHSGGGLSNGPRPGNGGDITGIFSVLVAGSDMDEPVADILRGVLDGHVVLDREIAERGRFPAVDLLRSVSRSLPLAATAEENALIGRARQLLGAYERAALMIRAGLYAAGSDPLIDAAIKVWPQLDAFLAEPEIACTADSFARLARVLGPGGTW